MARQLLADRLRAERLLAERALRELPKLREMSRLRSLDWLNALMVDIRRAEVGAAAVGKRATKARDEAILAVGLVGIALDRQSNRPDEVNASWDNAISRVQIWCEEIADKREAPEARASGAQRLPQ
jgi:hypothetical protein